MTWKVRANLVFQGGISLHILWRPRVARKPHWWSLHVIAGFELHYPCGANAFQAKPSLDQEKRSLLELSYSNQKFHITGYHNISMNHPNWASASSPPPFPTAWETFCWPLACQLRAFPAERRKTALHTNGGYVAIHTGFNRVKNAVYFSQTGIRERIASLMTMAISRTDKCP